MLANDPNSPETPMRYAGSIQKSKAVLLLACLPTVGSAATASGVAASSTVDEAPDRSIGYVRTAYTCKQADALKFNKKAFAGLHPDNQMIVDGVYQNCQILALRSKQSAQEKEDGDEVVMFANPVPVKGGSKVFYGRVKRKDLENARKNCRRGGKAVGVSLMVAGAATGVDATGQLGTAIYEYSGVSCDALKEEVAGDNLMALLAPSQIVQAAMLRKLTKDSLAPIPFVSDADKRKIVDAVGKGAAPIKVKVKPGELQLETPLVPGPIKLRPPKIKL